MQVNTEILGNGLGLVKLVIGPDEYRDVVNSELKNLRKKAQIKGFRAGMVPMSVVKKMFGKSVFAEQLNKVLEENLNKFMQETEWEIMANPLMVSSDMERMDIDGDKEYNFGFEVALKPSIEIPLLTDTETVFENYEIVVGDDLLDEEIERLQKQHGVTEEVENDIDETDSLEITLVELDAEGNVKEGGVESTTWLAVDMLKEEGPRESVLALKKGDDIDLDVFEAIDKELNQISSVVLNLKADEEGAFPETSGKFKMTINTVKRLKKAILDRELYLTVFGLKEEAETQESEAANEAGVATFNSAIPEVVTPELFREKIQESLSGQYNERTNSALWMKFYKHITDTTKVELAEEIMRNMWFHNNAKNEEIEDKEAAYQAYIRDMKWGVILEELAKYFELKIDNNEVVMGTVKEVSTMFRAYMGGQAVPDDLLKQLVEARLTDEEYVRNMGRQVTGEKVSLKLKEICTLDTKKVTIDEYNEILKKENEAAQAETEAVEETISDDSGIEDAVVVEEATSDDNGIEDAVVVEEEA